MKRFALPPPLTGRTTRYAFVAIIVLSTFGAAAAPDGAEATLDKYKDRVRTTPWAWKEDRANILHSLAQATSPYDVVVVRPATQDFALRFRIMDDQREVYAWWGHPHSVFVLKSNRLYYIKFAIEQPGGEVVAVDLKTGKKLWESPLRGVGWRPHSIYLNLVNIFVDGEIVGVYGNEDGGRYFEIKDARTGETVGHKIFKDLPTKPQ
jgi:hypothetical protein